MTELGVLVLESLVVGSSAGVLNDDNVLEAPARGVGTAGLVVLVGLGSLKLFLRDRGPVLTDEAREEVVVRA